MSRWRLTGCLIAVTVSVALWAGIAEVICHLT